MVDQPVPIGAKRWNSNPSDNPADYSVRDMLVTALARLDAGELAADHLVLVIGHIDENRMVGTNMMQAGSFDSYAQLGLMHDATRIFLHE